MIIDSDADTSTDGDPKSDQPVYVQRPILAVPLAEGSKAQEWLKRYKLQDAAYKVVTAKNSIYFPLIHVPNIAVPWPIQQKLVSARKKAVSHVVLLKNVLPDNLHLYIPHSFDQLGTLLLVKLDPALDSYKHEIGRILLQKFAVKSVFGKQGEVSSTYRISQWQQLAGDPNPETIYRMHGLRLKVNINVVYFNPRLGTEYAYIASLIKKGEIIIDMFAGIGPFTLMSTKQKKITVYACDINPHAIRLLQENIILNKKSLQGDIISKTGDIRNIISSFPKANRILMNLPATARDFLAIAIQQLQPGGIIHLHQFHRLPKEQPDLYIQQQQEVLMTQVTSLSREYFPGNASWTILSRIIREVSPSKSHLVWDISS